MHALTTLPASSRSDNPERWGPHALASLFGWGALLVAGSCLLPDRTAPGYALGLAGVAAGSALALVVFARRMSFVALNVVLALGTVLIALLVLSSGLATSPDALLFVWVGLFGGFFLGVRALTAQVAFVALAYGVVLMALLDDPSRTDEGAAQHLLLVVGAVAVAGGWVLLLRALVDSLLARQLQAARTDVLTGLPNRSELLRRGDQALKRRVRNGGDVAVLTIDFDDFRLAGGQHARTPGGALLEAVTQRLTTIMREVDVVARIGGNEFAVLLEGADLEAGVETAVERIVGSLSAPFELDDDTALIDASIGIAFAHGRESLDELLRHANVAMHTAKETGDGWARFTTDMHAELAQRSELVRDLRVALAEKQLSLRLQPIVGVQSRDLVAVEALVRWEHPEHGTIGPDRFIPIAESTGLIVPLGRWVLREACAQASGWSKDTATPPIISVNLSPRQLLAPDLVEDVVAALTENDLPACRLMLEVTETSIMVDPEAATARLDELSALGVALAVDDFGTGHSSLAYLRRLPVSDLKLARPFVRDLEDSAANVALARGIISLAHTLGMRVIAEGIEDTAQLERLRGMGCDLAQGFLFDRPLLPADLRDRLRRPPVPIDQPLAKRSPDSETLAVAAHRAVLATMPDHAFAVFDRDLRFIAMEGEALERAGWRLEDLRGRRPSDVLPPARGAEFEARLAAALAGRPQSFRWPSQRGPHVFEMLLRPLYDDGDHGGAQSIIALVRETEIVVERGPPPLELARDARATPANA